MKNNTGILVLGHGSSLPFNKEVVNTVADMIGKCNENTIVKTAFLNLDTPTLHEGLKSFEGTGVSRIVALPCFLATSHFDESDVLAKKDEVHSYISQLMHQGSEGLFRWKDSFKSALIMVNKNV